MRLTVPLLFLSVVLPSQSFFTTMSFKILRATAVSLVKISNVDNDCMAELAHFISEILEVKVWAIEMMDASSKIYPGQLKGNLHLMGDYDQCLAVRKKFDNRTIEGQYCTLVVTVPFGTSSLRSIADDNEVFKAFEKSQLGKVFNADTDLTLLLGMCFPKSCSAKNVGKFSNYIRKYFGLGGRITVVDELCHYKSKPVIISNLDYFALAFFALAFFVVLASTAYDLYLRSTAQNQNIFVTFSAYTNTRQLLESCLSNEHPLSCLCGFQAISIFCTMLFHLVFIHLGISKNLLQVAAEWTMNEINMLVWMFFYVVSTWFTITGVLTSYMYLKYTEKYTLSLVAFYCRKYIRQTPAILAMVLIPMTVFKFTATGPYAHFVFGHITNYCAHTWWSVLFLFTKAADLKMCASHLSYLVIDNHLYIVSPLILFYIKKYPRCIIAGMGVAFICSVYYTVKVTLVKRLGYTVFELDNDFLNYLYFSPMHHMASWLIGILCGYLLYHQKIKISKTTNLVLWILSFYVMINLITGHMFILSEDYFYRSALWHGLAKPLWSLAVSFIICSCATGHGGFVNTFLSSPVFKVLSKLNYCIFLLHFGVALSYFANQKESLHFSIYHVLYRTGALYTLVVIGAIVLHLVFEAPFISLMNYEKNHPKVKNKIKSN